MEESSQLRQGGPDAPNRGTDSDLVARFGKFIGRYRIFYIMAGALMAWWGRNIVVPLRESALTTAEVRLLNRKIDSVVVPRLNQADADRSTIIRIQENQGAILGVLTRLQCLRTTLRDRALLDLTCTSIPVEFPKATGGF